MARRAPTKHGKKPAVSKGKGRSAPSAKSIAIARDKIHTLDRLADIAAAARKRGQSVVLAHGVFDLLHLGHVRHLETARREGDVLIVTISADAVVNKGPGRPVFPESLRAEMLAALSIVDHVGVCRQSGAEHAIELIKPSIYVKGNEYQAAERDVTGRIVTERQLVERHGGRVVFTDDITFSSSALLNRYFRIYPPDLHKYLETVRDKGMEEQIQSLIDSIKGYRVLFVGDCILDEYQYVEPLGKSAKENIIATRYLNSEIFCGGVIAAANHLAGFCKEIGVLTVLGKLDSHEDLIRSNLKPNVELIPFVRDDAPTTRKRRMVDPGYTRKLFEVCYLNDSPLKPELQTKLDGWIEKHAADYDVVVVTDFGHGMIAQSTVDTLCRRARFLAVNAQTNSANLGFNLVTKYPRADYICVDAPEVRLAVGDRRLELEKVVTDLLASRVDCDRFIVTHGSNGCVAYDRAEGVHRIPAFTRTVVDTMGAGDAFLSITAPLVATGQPIDLVAFVGNAVGAIKVGIVGHRQSVDRAGLIKFITAMLK